MSPIDWCLGQLVGPPDGLVSYKHAMLFGFLEDHLATFSAEDKSRLDEILYTKYSDLAALHEMRVMVRLHHSRGTPESFDQYKKSKQRPVWRFIGAGFLDNAIPWFNKLGNYERVATLIKVFDKTPDPAAQSWLDRNDDLKKALNAFWEGVRTQQKLMFREPHLTTNDTRDVIKSISAFQDAEYIAVASAERQEVLDEMKAEEAEKAQKALLAAQYHKLSKHPKGQKTKGK